MPFSFLFSWWTRRPAARLEHLNFRILTRQGCHLCEVAWAQLVKEQQRCGFALEAVDVDTDQELTTLYGHEVPVVTVNGKVRFRGVVNPVLLTRLLRAEAARGTG
jgi:hypothetical protein